MSDLTLPPSARTQQQPVLGALLAGYGCYVNPAFVVKIEPAQRGNEWFVLAWLATDAESSQAQVAYLTPPYTEQSDAQAACDAICAAAFMSLTSKPGGGAWWEGDEAPAVGS